MKHFELTPQMYQYISLQRTGIKKNFETEYYNNLLTQWKIIEPYVTNEKIKVLDVGCGLAGIDYFISNLNNSNEINLLDKTHIDENVYYGYNTEGSFYNNLDLSEQFLRINGINNKINLLTPETDFSNFGKFDLILSLISWGFHYPIETYLERLNSTISDKGIFIIDIRHTILDSSIKLFENKGYSHQTIYKFTKCDKILFKRW